MGKKKHKIKVVKLKFSKPVIKAVQIPMNCTLADANKIESIFKNVKRSSWDTLEDAVYRFHVYEDLSGDYQVASRGTWIVRLYDPMIDSTKFIVLLESEYKRAFRKK